MAYIVSQLRKNTSTQYMTPVDGLFASTIISPNPFGQDDTFTDFAIAGSKEVSSATGQQTVTKIFEQGKVYYLRFQVCKIPKYFYSGSKAKDRVQLYNDADTLGLQILLKNSDENDEEEIPPEVIGNCLVPISEKTLNEYSSYSFVFTPSKSFDRLGFRINRVSFDAIEKQPLGDPNNTWKRDWLRDNYTYNNAERYNLNEVITYVNAPEKKIIWAGTDLGEGTDITDFADLCVLNNIIPNDQKWLKFGYQCRPGALIVVNGEPIRVGRSGIYLIDNGTEITSFMIASPGGSKTSNIDAFLLDYAYKSS